jgi:hypothetical protein
MTKRIVLLTAWILLQVSLAGAGLPEPTTPAKDLAAARRRVLAAPLSFMPNAGQWDGQIFFGATTSQGTVFFLQDAVVLAMPDRNGPPLQVRLEPLDIQSPVAPVAGAPTAAVTDYCIGNDPANWHTGVIGRDAVRYEGLYPGIDLRFHGDRRRLEYDFVVAPGADPGRIRVRLAGAESLRLESDGSLVATLPGGRELRQDIPAIYQEIDGERRSVDGRFLLAGETDGAPVFGFTLAAYDPAHPLVIDPTIEYSMYLGGMFNDLGNAMAIDPAGTAIYVTGSTLSSRFPGNGAQGDSESNTDVFLSRYDYNDGSDNKTVILAGLGTGDLAETANAIAVDASGVYITGTTLSTNFTIASPLYATRTGTKGDAFITKYDPTLTTMPFSTYFGGTGLDIGQAIALGAGALFVAGTTDSADLPVKNAFAPKNAGNDDGFILKMTTDGTAIYYATYYGGSQDDNITALAISDKGDAYFAGDTMSANLPVNSPLQTKLGGGKDAFVSRLGATGGELVFGTWVGGSGTDYATALVLDPTANMFIAGATNSTNFPVANALYPTKGGGYDAFLTKIDKTGRFLAFSTHLGGAGDDIGKALAVDALADGGLRYVYIGGQTASANFPVDNPWSTSIEGTPQNGYGYRGAVDGFLTKIDPNGRRLVHSSYFGGVAADSVNAMCANPTVGRTVLIAGTTASPSPTGGQSEAVSAFPININPALPAGVYRNLLGGGKTEGARIVDVTGQSDPFVATLSDTGYSTTVPTLSLGTATAAPMADVNVAFNLTYQDASTASGIMSLSTVLAYDPALLEFTSVTTPLAPAAYRLDWQHDVLGVLRLSITKISAGAAALAEGAVATVTFRVKYAGASTATMIGNTPSATTTTYVETMLTGVPGLATISQHCSMIGDCDCSGAVRIWEVQMAAQQVLTPAAADMCFKSDYTTMTAADLQFIINSHLFDTTVADPALAADAVALPDRRTGQGAVSLSKAVASETTMTTDLSLRTGGEAISLLLADIAFDPTQFSAVAVTAGPSAQAAAKDVSANVHEPGKLRLAALGLGDRQTMEDGIVARLVFTRRVPGQPLQGRLQLTADAASPDAAAVSLSAAPLVYPGAMNPLSAITLLLP